METAVVLVVESEALIRMSAVHIVEDAGYPALGASNADEAIAILDARRDIRAVFTDIRMPGTMDGLRLAHAIRHRWPPIRLLVTSGLNVSPDEEFPPNWRFILKPYTAEHVAAALHDLLGSHPAPLRLVADSRRNDGKLARR
ncbi:MAG: response regulator [Rhizomicrobium sp.]